MSFRLETWVRLTPLSASYRVDDAAALDNGLCADHDKIDALNHVANLVRMGGGRKGGGSATASTVGLEGLPSRRAAHAPQRRRSA